ARLNVIGCPGRCHGSRALWFSGSGARKALCFRRGPAPRPDRLCLSDAHGRDARRGHPELRRVGAASLRDPARPDLPIGSPWVRQIALELTALGSRSVVVVVLLIALGYLALERKYGAMRFVVVATCGGGVLSLAMKALITVHVLTERGGITPPGAP